MCGFGFFLFLSAVTKLLKRLMSSAGRAFQPAEEELRFLGAADFGAMAAGLGAKASAGLPSRLKGCSKKRAMESKCQAKQFKHDEVFGAPVPAQNKKTDVDLAFRPNVVLRRRWKDRFQPKIKGQM